jgi:hypothetical protein
MKAFIPYCKKYGKGFLHLLCCGSQNKITETLYHLDATKLIPLNMVLFKGLIIPQLLKKCPAHCGTIMSITVFTISGHN